MLQVHVLNALRLEALLTEKDTLEVWGYNGTKSRVVLPLTGSERGTFGAGFYVGDLACAVEFACEDNGEVLEFRIELQSPLIYDPDFDHEYDFDSPAVGLIQQLFDAKEAHEIIERSMAGDGYFGAEVRQRVLERGFDGVIVDYGDGIFEAVIYGDVGPLLERIMSVSEAKELLAPIATASARLG